jgi:3-hydroxybutyrate dehydrogenase
LVSSLHPLASILLGLGVPDFCNHITMSTSHHKGNIMNLKGSVALITGSTSGIGLASAHELARSGAEVMLNGFGNVDESIRAVSAHGSRVDYNGADLTKVEEIETLFAAIEKSFGKVDILVNNAGIQYVANIEDFPVARWNDIIALNLSAAFHCMRLALPGMKRRNFGRVVNIASAHGLVASAAKAPYVAAKHGLIGLTKAAALETAAFDITCNAICPGWVHTPLVQKQIEDRAAAKGSDIAEEQYALLTEKQPSGKFVSPEQVAKMVCFLCGDAAGEMRGSSIVMDGAWTAQ